MNDDPQMPVPPAKVPRGALWMSLSVPPAATVMGSLIAWLISKQSGGELILVVPLVVAALVLVLSFVFLSAIRTRYRGSSVGFLYIAYLMGQAVICLALWFGTCLLFLS